LRYSLIFEEFSKTVNTHPEKPAIFFKEDKTYRVLTYNEIYQKVVKLGNLIYPKIKSESENIVILLGNQPEWPIGFLALQYLGGVAVPIDIKLTLPEIRQLIIHSEARIILCSEKLFLELRPYLEDKKDLDILLVDSQEFKRRIEEASSEIKGEGGVSFPDKVAAMFYTSGTTDLPKAVLLSQKNLLSNAQSLKKLNLVSAQDVFISFLPLHHTYSFMGTCLVPLLLGATISYPASLSSEDLLDCMRETKVSILTGVPQVFMLFHNAIKEKLKRLPFITRGFLTIFIEIFWIVRKFFRINLSKYLLSKLHQAFGNNLRFMVSGGARLEPKVTIDFFKWGFTILEGYGLTETSPVVTINPLQKIKFGSVGRPIPDVELMIINPDNKGIGEVAIKGPNVMLGYYKLPQETERVLKGDWFFSSDLGYLDKDGYLYLVGRIDEIIVLSSGKKVNPEDIEKFYSLSPFIKEICVFVPKEKGLPAEAGQLIALVVPNEDYFRKLNLINIEEKVKWELDNISHRLSSFMRIKGFEICKNALPRTRLGKIMRHKVEEEYIKSITPIKREEEKIIGDEDLMLVSSEFYQKIIKYLYNRFKRMVSLDDHLELDLGLDSLGRMELLLELQKFLNLEFSDSLVDELFYARSIRELFQKIRPYLPRQVGEIKTVELLWPKILEQPLSSGIVKNIRLTPNILDRCIAISFKAFLHCLFSTFFLLKVKGKNNLPDKGPYIIYSNHSSYLDGFVIATLLPLELAINTFFVGFREYFFHPLSKNFVKIARLIPIDTNQRLVEAMQICSFLFKHKKIICFFPEGQRSPEGKIIPFKKGIGILVKELNVPLIPIYIKGAFHAWSRYRRFPRPARIEAVVGKKITYSELLPEEALKGDTYEVIAKGLEQELKKLINE
jgi:long-chain acyl-CoA synthetase